MPDVRDPTVGACRTCKAPVLWGLTPAGGRSPLDRDPAENGNVLLLRQSQLGVLAITLSGEALGMAREHGVQLRFSHWATCPDRKEWRERTDAKREEAVASG